MASCAWAVQAPVFGAVFAEIVVATGAATLAYPYAMLAKLVGISALHEPRAQAAVGPKDPGWNRMTRDQLVQRSLRTVRCDTSRPRSALVMTPGRVATGQALDGAWGITPPRVSCGGRLGRHVHTDIKLFGHAASRPSGFSISGTLAPATDNNSPTGLPPLDGSITAGSKLPKVCLHIIQRDAV